MRDALYSLPPANLPDTPETRRDMASFKASARSLDQGVGAVLNALDEHDLADDTLVVLTTDHGLAFPGAKATLTDRGIGVLLIIRGPGGFHGGRVSDALVSQVDLYPTLCELAGDRAARRGVQGRSLLPLVRTRGRRDPRRDLRRAHLPRRLRAAARDPHAALQVHPPLRRPATSPCCRTSTTARARTLLLAARAGRERPRPARASSTTSSSTPTRPDNLAGDPAYAGVSGTSCASGCDALDARDRRPAARRPGRAAPPGAELNDPASVSAAEHRLAPAGS